MHTNRRPVLAIVLLLLVAGIVHAQEDAPRTDEEHARDLRDRIESLRSREDSAVAEQVEDYLDDWEPRQAERARETVWDRLAIVARFTAVSQSTVNLEPSDRSVVNGDVDIDLAFQAAEQLTVFLSLTANPSKGGQLGDGPGFPPQFPHVDPLFPSIGILPGATLSGLTDGIGVDGTRPVAPGSLTVYEAGIRHSFALGKIRLHWSVGRLDPRARFLQSAFADDENRQFLNNLFDDTPSALWLSDASGRDYFGIYMWVPLGGDRGQYTLSWGWFSTPGRFWVNGQFYAQLEWQGEVSRREMNVRIMGWIDEFFEDATGRGDTGAGVSWDWLATDRLGVFLRLAGNSNDLNPVRWDAQAGVEIRQVFGRAHDRIGIGLGVQQINHEVAEKLGLEPSDRETVFEIYYLFALEDGHLQITPNLMAVIDPGAGLPGWEDDLLVMLGLRVFVNF